ncbi:CLUMA_CG020260, isoform A [Clunio marinus]|uniref:CLUMA_CG020260, isoform A n=1 Tax=Clunio marinus TaxID=568069 RepID=A0A1J1J8Q0_9DIPT|nr:CLUMA_CG020260, isoform A [Clunio marinus]
MNVLKGTHCTYTDTAEDSINVLTNLNNKKIGGKHIAIRYAKHVDAVDDGKSSKHVKIPALAAGSVSNFSQADKKSKIQLIEEQLKNLQNSSNDFEINLNKNIQPSEPLIKKYQYNKDNPTTNNSRYNYQKRKRKQY